MGREDEIRMIAFALWVQDGYNRASAVRHWLQAEAIWEQNQKALGRPAQPAEESERELAGIFSMPNSR